MDRGEAQAFAALAQRFRRNLTEALQAGNRLEAERVVREAVDAGLTKQAIFDEIIAAAMHDVGAKWESGEMSVADEHLATSISYGLLALVSELTRVEERRRDEPIVLCAIQGEQHVMGLRMAGDVLEGAGFPVFFLGPDVPTDDLLDLLTRKSVSICGLSATMPEARAQLDETVRLITDLVPQVRVLVGGQAAEGLPPLGPTVARVEEVGSVVEAADGLLQAAALN